jgi:hypothetical protein
MSPERHQRRRAGQLVVAGGLALALMVGGGWWTGQYRDCVRADAPRRDQNASRQVVYTFLILAAEARWGAAVIEYQAGDEGHGNIDAFASEQYFRMAAQIRDVPRLSCRKPLPDAT